jgi:flavin reductase (DIM6/NTAB) family NADH-FMN oxidoreductase RutF
MLIDYSQKQLTQRYQLMAQTIIPRPIAWIVTYNTQGEINIAPFSYFMGLSSEPPTMVVSIGHKKDGSPKDTLQNIRDTRKCTICMVEQPLLEKMHFSSKELDANISEAQEFEIETRKIVEEFPPIVEGVHNAFFCEFLQEIQIKGSKTIPLVVEIKQQFIDESILSDTKNITINYKPIARVGKSYALLSQEITPPTIP